MRNLAVKHIRIQINFIGPLNCPSHSIHTHKMKILYILKGCKDSPTPDNSIAKINFTMHAIGKLSSRM